MNSIAKPLPLVLIGTLALMSCAIADPDTPEDTAQERPPEIGPGGSADFVPFCDEVTTWDPAWTQLEDQVLTLVNQRRAQGATCGMTTYAPAPALTFNERLRCAARKHSKDMGVNNIFSHTGSDDSTPGQRITNAGYIFTMAAENIAAGPATAAAVVEAWMGSVDHCPNIMDPALKHLGTGYYYAGSTTYKHYWTQNFGATQNSPEPPVTRRRFDFDGDGKADIAVFRPSDGGWYFMRPDGSFYGFPFGQSGDIPVAADYDRDGKSDAAVFRAGVWYLQQSTAGLSVVNFGLPSDIPAPADYDGDGAADIAVFRPSDGTWVILMSSNGQALFAQFGSTGDIPVPGDFDGDKKADISVFRPTDGAWYRLNSSTNAFFGVQFGSNGDRPLAGDFDGDGKADPAVFRASDSGWYVLASSTDAMQVTTFGVSDDIPVPADYDGDGKDDVAVFRRSDAGWYRLNSGNNAFAGALFGASTDTPVAALPVP